MDRTLLLTEGSFGRLLASQLPAKASHDAAKEPLFMVKCLGDGSYLTRERDCSVFRMDAADFFTKAEVQRLGYHTLACYRVIPVRED